MAITKKSSPAISFAFSLSLICSCLYSCAGLQVSPPPFTSLRALDVKLSLLIPPTVVPDPPPLSLEGEHLPHPIVLFDYWDKELSSFNVNGAVTLNSGRPNRLSVTSTCYALTALKEFEFSDAFILSVSKKVMQTEWRENDWFQAPLIMNMLMSDMNDSESKFKVEEEHVEKVKKLVVGLLEERPRRRLGDRQKHSSYIQYQISKALVGMLKSLDGSAPSSQLPPVALPSSLYGELTLAVSRAFEVSRDEMCRQIAYHAAGDDRTFDSTRLAYSILTYVAAGNGLVNSAGVQMNYGEEDSAIVGKGVGVNKKVLMKAVDVFMGCQNNDGMWPQGQSIYSTFNRKDTNVGNAFVFSCDTLGEMLQVCGKDVFASHMDGVERLVDWCDRNYVSEVVTLECDVESGECFGKQRRGWVSNHFPPGTGATAWSTAQALIFMARARRITRSLMNDAVLSEFGGTSSGGRDEGGWKRLVDADVAEGVTLKNIIMERVLEPRATASAATSQKLAAHSAVLFGPPGTAKTTICKGVADFLGWDFVVIDTATFLASGLSDVSGRIRYVFDRLKKIEKCVILFDEIEEFCLDRENQALGMESRMLTTALLTQINDLRKAEKSVFFLATNRLKALDSAITRPGRFDMQLFVGTPNLSARVERFREKLEIVGATGIDEAVDAFEKALSQEWENYGQFFNFIEGEILADACAGMAVSDGIVKPKDVAALIKRQVVTIRGTDAKNEYVEGSALSRW